MLIDAKGFDDYENRESVIVQPPKFDSDSFNDSMLITEIEDVNADFASLSLSLSQSQSRNGSIVSFPDETNGAGGDTVVTSPKPE